MNPSNADFTLILQVIEEEVRTTRDSGGEKERVRVRRVTYQVEEGGEEEMRRS